MTLGPERPENAIFPIVIQVTFRYHAQYLETVAKREPILSIDTILHPFVRYCQLISLMMS